MLNEEEKKEVKNELEKEALEKAAILIKGNLDAKGVPVNYDTLWAFLAGFETGKLAKASQMSEEFEDRVTGLMAELGVTLNFKQAEEIRNNNK